LGYASANGGHLVEGGPYAQPGAGVYGQPGITPPAPVPVAQPGVPTDWPTVVTPEPAGAGAPPSQPGVPTPTSTASAGGLGQTLKGIAPYAQLGSLGALGLLALQGPAKLPGAAQQALGSANTLGQQGALNLANAQAGIITPYQQQTAASLYQNAYNQAWQQYVSMGRDPSKDSSFGQTVQAIANQQAALIQSYLDQAAQLGLQETNASNSILTQVAQLQAAANQNFTNSLSQALLAAGRLGLGLGSSSTAAGGAGTFAAVA
jgi:hypothetical protein